MMGRIWLNFELCLSQNGQMAAIFEFLEWQRHLAYSLKIYCLFINIRQMAPAYCLSSIYVLWRYATYQLFLHKLLSTIARCRMFHVCKFQSLSDSSCWCVTRWHAMCTTIHLLSRLAAVKMISYWSWAVLIVSVVVRTNRNTCGSWWANQTWGFSYNLFVICVSLVC